MRRDEKVVYWKVSVDLKSVCKARFTLTEVFWHGSCEIGTGSKKEHSKLCLHYTIFIVPELLAPRNFSWSHAQFNYNEERPRDFGGE